ncbi:MAG: hypothetical protein DME26_07435, partial [Verrucomicrobia bacterium]
IPLDLIDRRALIEVMLPINRRQFIKTGTAATALSLLPGSLQAAYTQRGQFPPERFRHLQGDSLAGQRAHWRISFERQSQANWSRFDRFSESHPGHRRYRLQRLGASGDRRSVRQRERRHENQSGVHPRAAGPALIGGRQDE